MTFTESVNFFFTIKNFFLLSVIDKKNFESSRIRLQILLIFILTLIGTIISLEFFGHHHKIKSENKKIQKISKFCMYFCQTLVWITTAFYRKRESEFFTELVRIDKILEKYGSFDEIYRNFSNASKKIVFPIIAYIFLSYVVIKGYFDATQGLKISSTISFFIINLVSVSIFMYTFVFYFDVKLLRDRFRLIKDLAKTCNTIEAYEELEGAHKSLILLMDTVNDSFGVKLGFVLVSNFFVSIITSYNIFVSFMEPKNRTIRTYFDMFGNLCPNIVMLFMSFLSGEWITIDVSLCFLFFFLKK